MNACCRRVAALITGPLLVSSCGLAVSSPAPARPSTAAEVIHLVALGDSTPAGYGVVDSYVDIYARDAATDLDARVDVRNWARSGFRASEVLSALQEDESLRRDVQDADCIMIWVGFNDIYPAIGIDRDGATCGPWAELDLECVRERVARLTAAIDGIVTEILALVDPAEALILFADVGNPLADAWAEAGVLEELKEPVMEAWIDHITITCEGTGIRVVHTYEILNGPAGGQSVDPTILQDDGLHLNAKGHQLLADVHRRMGYGPLER